MLLFALDTAEEALDGVARAKIAAVRRMLTSKLWPELGDLLEDRGED